MKIFCAIVNANVELNTRGENFYITTKNSVKHFTLIFAMSTDVCLASFHIRLLE